jgi:hypothetical protein
VIRGSHVRASDFFVIARRLAILHRAKFAGASITARLMRRVCRNADETAANVARSQTEFGF